MTRWRYAWNELRYAFDGAWERQKERDAMSWCPAYERFSTYIAWPFACVLLALILLPLAAVSWDRP